MSETSTNGAGAADDAAADREDQRAVGELGFGAGRRAAPAGVPDPELVAQAKREGAECLVTTEKDAVRIPEGYVWPMPVYYLRLEIELISGAADFNEAVDRICFPEKGARAIG